MLQFGFGTGSPRRNGAAIVLTVVTLVVLLGFAALTIDVGAMYNTRADLQNAADAAALAAASGFASDAMLRVRQGINSSGDIAEVRSMIRDRARKTGVENSSFGAAGSVIDPDDIVSGWIDLSSGSSPLDPTRPFETHNAVRITVRRTRNSQNGPVNFFFASIFGKRQGEVTASAVAAYDDRLRGYETRQGGADLWPFTVSVSYYDKQVAAGSDVYAYDESTGRVSSGQDETPEVNIYPVKLAPGNFGQLNIGIGNQGNNPIEDQILHGVTPEQVKNETGSSQMTFVGADGQPETYLITGNPGINSMLEGALLKRVGDIVAVPVHDQVTESGATSVYRIVGIRFVRVMDAQLQGSSKKRGLWLQPVNYSGSGVVTSEEAPSSEGNAGVVLLVR